MSLTMAPGSPSWSGGGAGTLGAPPSDFGTPTGTGRSFDRPRSSGATTRAAVFDKDGVRSIGGMTAARHLITMERSDERKTWMHYNVYHRDPTITFTRQAKDPLAEMRPAGACDPRDKKWATRTRGHVHTADLAGNRKGVRE